MIIPNDFSITITKTYEDNSINNQSFSLNKYIEYNNKNMNNYIINSIRNKLKKNSQSMINLQHHNKKEKMQGNVFSKDKIHSKKILPLFELEKNIYKNFKNLYVDNDYYNIIKIDEIINNEKSHLVAEFKDFLVKGDTAEFLIEFYNIKEINVIYPQILQYYNDNLFIFPNYVTLPESKYIYVNIQKKQKIIDIQEEFHDNEIRRIKDKNDDKVIFTCNEIDSLLNQTDTSGIKKFFGISETNTENSNVIDKNEQQILKLIDNINDIEKKNQNYKNSSVYLKHNNLSKLIRVDNKNNHKLFHKINYYKYKGENGNNNKEKNNNNNYNTIFYEVKKEGRASNKRNNLSQQSIKNQNIHNKTINSTILNSINNKNNHKEKIKKSKKKIIGKEINSNVKKTSKKKIIENLCYKNNDNQLFKKLLNKNVASPSENTPININYNINVITKIDNKIKINKNILNEINNYNSKDKDKDKDNLVSAMKSKSYKKALMNALMISRNGSINENNFIKSNISKNSIKHKSNSCNEIVLDQFLSSTINAIENSTKNSINKKKYFLNDNKNNLKLGKEQKQEASNKNKLSASCKNMSINAYITKRIKSRKNNKNTIQYYSNRNHYNSSYKIMTIISNTKNVNKDNKNTFKFSDNYLICEEKRNNINKIIKKKESKTLVDSYSTKEMTNKNRISKDSYKNIFETKLFKEIKNQNVLNKSKKTINYKDYKKLNRSPFKNNELPLTDRKAKDQIEFNLEKIELLSKEIKKMKENLRNSVDKNTISSNSNRNTTKFNIKNNNNKEDQKFINYNNSNNVIKVYLSNKTRNKSKKKKNKLNSEIFGSNDTYNPRIRNYAYTFRRKENNEQKTNKFKTLNKINVNNNIGQKNSIDSLCKIQFNAKNYNNKKEKDK